MMPQTGAPLRIALIHALKLSIPPIEDAFARLWPEVTLRNVLDDSLAADLARGATLDDAMTQRFLTLARYAVASGADGILFTCSAFGPCIEACAAALPVPVLKPNEAAIDAAAAAGRVGLVASFAPTLASMPAEFPPGTPIEMALAGSAMAALAAGRGAEHDADAAAAAATLGDCDVILLAQFSLARAATAVAAATGKTVLTTPDCAVERLRGLLQPA